MIEDTKVHGEAGLSYIRRLVECLQGKIDRFLKKEENGDDEDDDDDDDEEEEEEEKEDEPEIDPGAVDGVTYLVCRHIEACAHNHNTVATRGERERERERENLDLPGHPRLCKRLATQGTVLPLLATRPGPHFSPHIA